MNGYFDDGKYFAKTTGTVDNYDRIIIIAKP